MAVPKIEQIIGRIRDLLDINLHLVKGFKFVRIQGDAAHYGFDFTVDDRPALERAIRGSTKMAEDFSHKPHYAPWDTTPHFGFTEVTQPDIDNGKWPEAIHIDFCLNPKGICGVHFDRDKRVVGRDRFGNAICNFSNHPVVKNVIHEVGLRGIHLNSFEIRPIKVYEDPEPFGFDFESPDIGAIESVVQSLSTHNPRTPARPFKMPQINPLDFNKKPNTADPPFRHDSSSDPTGWVGNRVTLGEGYREKGFGARVHIELAKDWGLGNVHLDTHPYLNPDGSPNLRQAALHGIFDLAPGFGLAGRSTNFIWQIGAGLSVTPKGSKQSVEVGIPIQPAGGQGPIQGWTFGVNLTIRRRQKRK